MTFVSTRVVRIEWGDCDAAGIVFYPRYFAIFNECTVHLFEAAGFGLKRDMLERYDIAGWPMVDTRAKFIRPARFGDDLRILTCITAIGRSSFEIRHEAYMDETLVLEGSETRVWASAAPDRPSGIKAAPFPPEIRQILLPDSKYQQVC